MSENQENAALKKAREKIEEARRTRAHHLSLIGMRIIELPESIAQLSRLETLSLSHNQLTALPESIAQLSRLEILNLSRNQLTELPESIAQLSRLEILDLSRNQLTALPESIAQLAQLKELDLSYNQFTALPESIGQLSRLKTLDFGGNQLTALPESIGQLSQLSLLGLGSNRLTTLPDSIAQLSQLRRLYLWGNQLTALPATIAQLSQLENLHLSNNQLTALPATIAQLSQLDGLHLSNNQLTALPATIAQLSQLEGLHLSNNRLTALPGAIAQLSRLKALDLSNNQLKSLPEQLTQLPVLEALFLHGNPALRIPDEILGPPSDKVFGGIKPKPPHEILAYLFQAARPLNEAKLILVGHGAVGKTSLVKALAEGKFNKREKTTEGIKINDWACALTRKEEVTVHIWDFGGQEMMHATHQFFLTRRSLYLLVLNRRTGGVDREADYWFRMIRAFGGPDAPVIVVLNKQKSEPFDVNREGWLQKYKGNIKGFVSTDCEDKRSIRELKRSITGELRAMESLKARFPRRWFAIKNELSQMAADHISFESYRALCQKHGEADPANQTLLAGFLHDLGIALNYRQDQRLSFNYILKPEWVTNGIYALLHAFVRNNGVFTQTEAGRVLGRISYSSEDTHFILGLMERFELSFPLGDKHNRVLMPELLEDQQPKEAATFKASECLNFGYKYTILSEGLLPRFIVRTHHLSRGETRWKSGVILQDESTGCRALVRADAAEAEVRIHLDGPEAARPELLGIIRHNFQVIHSDYEMKPAALVYPPAAPQKAIVLSELQALKKSHATSIPVVLPDETVVQQDIAALVDPVVSTPPPLKLFLSYSHKDEDAIDELRKDLVLMERNGLVHPWHDRTLVAGEKWEARLLQELNDADIIVCQLSRDFLASEFCTLRELGTAIKRQEAGEAALVAYVLTHCGWEEVPRLREFQMLPKDTKPLVDWPDKNMYWRAVAEGLQMAVKRMQVRKKDRHRERRAAGLS